jgi:hypothetical protein
MSLKVFPIRIGLLEKEPSRAGKVAVELKNRAITINK